MKTPGAGRVRRWRALPVVSRATGTAVPRTRETCRRRGREALVPSSHRVSVAAGFLTAPASLVAGAAGACRRFGRRAGGGRGRLALRSAVLRRAASPVSRSGRDRSARTRQTIRQHDHERKHNAAGNDNPDRVAMTRRCPCLDRNGYRGDLDGVRPQRISSFDPR